MYFSVVLYTSMYICFLDIDECKNNPCSQNCTNTDGSFQCFCKPGYKVNNKNNYLCDGMSNKSFCWTLLYVRNDITITKKGKNNNTYLAINPCGVGPVYRREKKCQIVLLVAWYVTSEKSFFSRSNQHGWKEDEIYYRLVPLTTSLSLFYRQKCHFKFDVAKKNFPKILTPFKNWAAL